MTEWLVSGLVVLALGIYLEIRRLHSRLDWYFDHYLKRRDGGSD